MKLLSKSSKLKNTSRNDKAMNIKEHDTMVIIEPIKPKAFPLINN